MQTAKLPFMHDIGDKKTSLKLFLKRWPSLGEHLFDHLLWSIFQSSIHKHYKLQTDWLGPRPVNKRSKE